MNKILLLYNLDYILINKNLRRLNIWMTFFRETNAFPSRLENIPLTLTRQTGLVVVTMVMFDCDNNDDDVDGDNGVEGDNDDNDDDGD